MGSEERKDGHGFIDTRKYAIIGAKILDWNKQYDKLCNYFSSR